MVYLCCRVIGLHVTMDYFNVMIFVSYQPVGVHVNMLTGNLFKRMSKLLDDEVDQALLRILVVISEM